MRTEEALLEIFDARHFNCVVRCGGACGCEPLLRWACRRRAQTFVSGRSARPREGSLPREWTGTPDISEYIDQHRRRFGASSAVGSRESANGRGQDVEEESVRILARAGRAQSRRLGVAGELVHRFGLEVARVVALGKLRFRFSPYPVDHAAALDRGAVGDLLGPAV